MATKSFGELFKELRLKQGLTLREFCKQHNYDPGNISKMERGMAPPPAKEESLEALAFAVGLREGTPDWREFMSVGIVHAGKIPREIMSDKEALRHLPAFLRTLSGEKLTADQLHDLIEVIRTS